MHQLSIVAHIRAKADRIPLVKSELEKLIIPTRGEPGCLQYDLHQDNRDPAHFLFFERWESMESLQAHEKSPHIRDFQKAVEGAIESFTLHEMTRIG
ncbi:antibiotic biosynthesis monooxygenase [Microbulbifer thermotolerans]|uniref:Antibiotic biosynthesis monooxygenase n=1 Tax=Microbulbifer thermotolerans TaxID=252514 RepID=A0AB35HVX7_MICTH|nr:putative quinol monooxygenase [Microbulbifer thermotolerans]MCX2778530.1 antibiotic biosynthesis monooxygenase [Microbulbifer thermotolerans]MCX2782916.1 antibiotic biosynthesis monooxygenase [Microbulbifer thermotolerans]MCX2794014.1 antibiotic biosynthesis monooxygenase [Microbulbifer thermotolerans]MCX2801718.1 antibiotic biosynthesis monooxygenase [Microbulbifer thermotolerans]MCX2803961.1 antibiotic biosynthesis monooxygenase [Microbulbifer thermotolerans]